MISLGLGVGWSVGLGVGVSVKATLPPAHSPVFKGFPGDFYALGGVLKKYRHTPCSLKGKGL